MLKFFYLCALLVFSLLYAWLLLYPVGNEVKPAPSIDAAYLPGQVATTRGAICAMSEYLRYALEYITCNTGKISYSFDDKTHRIVCASTGLQNYTVGDLILIWGTPIGFRNNYGVISIFWKGKHIFTPETDFSPNSKAFYLIYQDDPIYFKWSGFSTRRTG